MWSAMCFSTCATQTIKIKMKMKIMMMLKKMMMMNDDEDDDDDLFSRNLNFFLFESCLLIPPAGNSQNKLLIIDFLEIVRVYLIIDS